MCPRLALVVVRHSLVGLADCQDTHLIALDRVVGIEIRDEVGIYLVLVIGVAESHACYIKLAALGLLVFQAKCFVLLVPYWSIS